MRIVLFLVALSALAAPEWVADPANSIWLAPGENHGLVFREDNSEGAVHAAEQAGESGVVSRRPEDGKPGYFYIRYTAEQPLVRWLGEDAEALLVIRYFDGGAGVMRVKYDSSEPKVYHPAYPAGVWKVPPEAENGVPLSGDGTWHTLRLRLPLALFHGRVHMADIRVEPTSEGFVLGGVAVRRVPRGEEPAALVEMPVRVATTTGFAAGSETARFAGTFAQQADQPIAIEAELATRLGFMDGRGPGVDPAASGGAYIHYVANAVYEIEVATPGRYRMWERASFPWAGGWNHAESMNGRGVQVTDSVGQPKPGWQWVQGPVYDLAAGRNVFTTSYHGGAKLDLLVLSRDLETPPAATPASSYVGPGSGELTTVAIEPFDVAGWRNVDFALGEPDRWTVEYSLDDGASWAPLPAGGDLAGLPVQGGGKDRLTFRLHVAGAGPPPLFAGGTVRYLAGPANYRTVEAGSLRVRFSPSAILGIRNTAGDQLVSAGPTLPPALGRLLVKAPGDAEPRTLDFYDATFAGLDVTGSTVTLRHRFAEGIATTSTLAFTDAGHIVATMAIANDSDLEVAELRYPVVSGVRLGGNGDDDWLHVSRCWGQIVQPPNAVGHLWTHWGTSMRWLGVWDADLGLYLGIEDPECRDYAFVFGPDASPGGITIASQQRILAPPHGRWQSPVYRLAVTRGGSWQPLADVYRDYTARALAAPKPPPYVKWLVDVWGAQQSNWMPWSGWDTIRRSYDDMAPDHVFLMPANRQMTDGADSGYCGLYPYPALTWGSTREFSQQLAALRARGGFYTPYHNFHLWAPGYGHYQRIGSFAKTMLPADAPKPDDDWYHRATERTYGGSYTHAEEDYFAQIGMAMPSREWRDWLADWTARYLAWGADGMYYDQYNMIYPNGRLYPDFPTYGSWMPATLAISRRLYEASTAVNPYYTSSGEVANDVYGQYLHLHMTSGVFKRLDIFQYCNPGQLLLDGAWNGGLNAERFGGWENERFIWQVGARFEQLQGPTGRWDAWSRSVLELRRAVRSLIYDATYRDTVGLDIRDRQGRPLGPEPGGPWEKEHLGAWRGTIARWFRFAEAGQQGAVVNIINEPRQKGATCTLTSDLELTTAVAWTLAGGRLVLPLEQLGEGRVRFPVPDAELASVVLSGGLRPVVKWSLDPVTARGETLYLELDLTNVNDSVMRGRLVPDLPRGFSADTVDFGPLAPGASLRLRLPVAVGRRAELGRHDLWVNVASNRGDFRVYHFAVVNDPVLVEFGGDPGDYHLLCRNLTDEAATARVTVTAPAPLTVGTTADAVAIPPYSEVRIPVAVHGREDLAANTEMTARIRLGRGEIERVRGIMPLVANGTFEADSAGDAKPDFWMCRGRGDRWSYERIHVDELPDGNHVLRLDPAPAETGFTRAYPVNGAFAVGRRYRVSGRIKGAADGVFINCYAYVGNGKTGPDWAAFSHEFTAVQTAMGLSLHNHSREPAWFDDIRIEPIE